MKTTLCIVTVLAICLASCNEIKDTAKEGLNKGGEMVGKGASEFMEGVTEGVDRTLECTLLLSDSLKAKGISHGVFSISSSANASNNVASVYFVFSQDFRGDITMKAVTKEGLEAGRATTNIIAKANDAQHVDFAFDPRTHIDVRSTLELY